MWKITENRYGVYLEVEGIELIALCEDMVPQCGKKCLYQPKIQRKIQFVQKKKMGKSNRIIQKENSKCL